jgi:hypothetical protein
MYSWLESLKSGSEALFIITWNMNIHPLQDLFILTHPDTLKRGEKVRIIKGAYAGLEGELCRIKGHKRVVVKLWNEVAVATHYIPKDHLERISTETV